MKDIKGCSLSVDEINNFVIEINKLGVVMESIEDDEDNKILFVTTKVPFNSEIKNKEGEYLCADKCAREVKAILNKYFFDYFDDETTIKVLFRVGSYDWTLKESEEVEEKIKSKIKENKLYYYNLSNE